MSALSAFSFLGGLALLLAGAEIMVRGASSLARAYGIPPLIVGLTIVAFGTSSPELAIATSASLSGNGEIVVGNVLGSNIANVLLILGVAAVVSPLVVTRQLIRNDVPVMIGLSVLAYVFAMDGSIARWEGVVLLVLAAVYTGFLVRAARRRRSASISEEKEPPARRATDALLIVGGLVMLVLGSKLLVSGATDIARAMNVSELVIGLTVVAIGTSAPEIATTVIAAVRGQREIAVGGVIGSNIYNIVLVLGVGAAISPSSLAVPPAALHFDFPVMLAVAFACLPIFFVGFKVMRWEGALFLFYYIAYTAYLVLASKHHDALSTFSAVMGGFVIPLTVLTLVALSVHAWYKYQRDGLPEDC